MAGEGVANIGVGRVEGARVAGGGFGLVLCGFVFPRILFGLEALRLVAGG